MVTEVSQTFIVNNLAPQLLNCWECARKWETIDGIYSVLAVKVMDRKPNMCTYYDT